MYPWDFVRTNTIFSVVHESGGYTAWIDKHASYSFVAGHGGKGLDDYYSPEVDSTVVPLPGVTTATGVSCATIRDTSASSSWTSSFANIQCYDALKVHALLNEIAGKTHNGAAAASHRLFGMNFQAVYIGECVNEPSVGMGGYQDAAATPSASLVRRSNLSTPRSATSLTRSRTLASMKTRLSSSRPSMEGRQSTRAYVADGANTPATLLGSASPSRSRR